MKASSVLASCLIAASLLTACVIPRSEIEEVLNVSKLTALVKAIKAIPQSQDLLPASLQDAPPPPRPGARAIGDITSVDPTALPGVRSEGYVRMQKEIAESVLANLVTALQLGLASTQELTYDAPLALGDVTVTLDQAAVIGVPAKFDAGSLLAHKNDDGTVTVKWHFAGDSQNFRLPDALITGAAGTYEYWVQLLLTNVDDPTQLQAVVSLRGDQTLTEAKGTYASGTVFTVGIRGRYDVAAGTQTTLFDPVLINGAATADAGRYEAVTVAGGETSYLSVDADSFNAAWGDAVRGGVLAKGTWTDTDPVTGQDVALTQYRSEVYNGTGELLKEKVASNAPGGQFAFLKDLDNGKGADKKFVNLADYPSLYSGTPPASFRIKAWESWDLAGARSVSKMAYSTDGTTWTTFFDGTTTAPATFVTLVPWIVTWRTGIGTEASAWQTGDQVYFTSDSDGSAYDSGKGYTVYTYQLDFLYAAPATLYEGDTGTYYQHSTFPLKTLRLSSALSALNYVIESQETGSVTKTAQDGTPYAAAQYQFWLQKPDGSGAMRTSPLGFAPWLGDLEISGALHQREFWTWDAEAQTRSNVQSYVVTTSVELPPAFQLPPEETTLAADLTAVETALATQATTALALQASGLTQAALDLLAADLGVQAIGTGDLADYPALP